MNRLKHKLPIVLLLVSVLGIAVLVVIAQSQNSENNETDKSESEPNQSVNSDLQTKDNFDDNRNLARIFRLVNGLNKEADKQEAKGFSKRAERVRSHFQKKTGISDEAKLKINQLAGTFQKENESLNSKIKEIRKNQENKPNDEASTSELEKLRETRNKLYEESRQSLHNNLSKDDLNKVLKFFREQILAKMKKTKKSESPKEFKDKLNSFKKISYKESFSEAYIEGYSIIEYDDVNNEIWSTSITEGYCPENPLDGQTTIRKQRLSGNTSVCNYV